MRNLFSDQYNLVTVQCDYFGWEFMQEAKNITFKWDKYKIQEQFKREEVGYIYQDENIFERLMEVACINTVNVPDKEDLKESLGNYNDMGLLQVLDNISSVISVIEIIKDNGFEYNKDKVILYGHSHGAYLS